MRYLISRKEIIVLGVEKDKGGGMMERLTKKGFNFTTNFIKRDIDSWSIAQCLKKLQEYEDAEEQGLLLRLPCPIGTTVYNTTWWDDVTEKVDVDGKTFYRTVHKHKVSKSTFSLVDIYDFGKTVFLTKAEAEQKLKEMESD